MHLGSISLHKQLTVQAFRRKLSLIIPPSGPQTFLINSVSESCREKKRKMTKRKGTYKVVEAVKQKNRENENRLRFIADKGMKNIRRRKQMNKGKVMYVQ
jgi:hypothetical protein